MSAEKHLWEIEHSYYAEQGNYLVAPVDHRGLEAHVEYKSWEEFYEFATSSDFSDPDLNLVYRWDWHVPDPEYLEEGEEIPSEQLLLYVIQQRKAYNHSFSVNVTREDEPAIKEWLTERAETVRSIWSPLLDKAMEEL